MLYSNIFPWNSSDVNFWIPLVTVINWKKAECLKASTNALRGSFHSDASAKNILLRSHIQKYAPHTHELIKCKDDMPVSLVEKTLKRKGTSEALIGLLEALDGKTLSFHLLSIAPYSPPPVPASTWHSIWATDNTRSYEEMNEWRHIWYRVIAVHSWKKSWGCLFKINLNYMLKGTRGSAKSSGL